MFEDPKIKLRTLLLTGCPVCQDTDIISSMKIKDFLHGVPGSFSYSRCQGCKSVYQNPRVIDQDIPLCYPSSYFTHSIQNHPPFHGISPCRSLLRNVIRHYSDGTPLGKTPWSFRFLGLLLSYIPSLRKRARYGLPDQLSTSGEDSDRCLEVGPGLGIELAQLSAIGWKAFGLEFDPIAAETARQVSKCDVRVGTLLTADFPLNWFRLIYMSHVLEHLSEPTPSLKKAYDLLVPSGRIFLIYPSPDSMVTKLYQEFSWNWDPPRHLVLPSCKGIKMMLEKVGFRQIKVTTSARRAGAFRAVATAFKSGKEISSLPFKPNISNKIFYLIEQAFVLFGFPMGEEILVSAYK